MSDCNPEGRIFLSVPHTNDRFFFLHTFHFWKTVFDNAVTSIADVRHIVMTITWRLLTSLGLVTSALTMAHRDVIYNQCISNTWKFSIFILTTGWIRMCEIRFASTGVICGNPYLVCKFCIYNVYLGPQIFCCLGDRNNLHSFHFLVISWIFIY